MIACVVAAAKDHLNPSRYSFAHLSLSLVINSMDRPVNLLRRNRNRKEDKNERAVLSKRTAVSIPPITARNHASMHDPVR